MTFIDLGMPLFVPFCYQGKDILDLLDGILSPGHVREIALDLMTRRFGHLWQHRGLLQMMRHTCLICHQDVELRHLHRHLRVEHDMDINRFMYHILQLAEIFLDIQEEMTSSESKC